jgi:futalosine hydrolase
VRILLVAATAAEIDPLARGARRFARAGHDIDVLVTGVGMVPTAAHVSAALARQHFDWALNVGLCGSFDSALPPGTVVHVVSEELAEVGADDDEGFLTLVDLRLLQKDEFPFQDARLVNTSPPGNEVIGRLPRVNGITVNTVHGNERSIAAVVRRCRPQVESMEGAAFMYACLLQKMPFAEVRAVSNVVERRNRGAWKIAEAIDNLNATASEIIERA